MKDIKIELTTEEINTIIEALGQMPFIKVYKIIEKIHLQSKAQLQVNTEIIKK